jgi:hypothetical protein
MTKLPVGFLVLFCGAFILFHLQRPRLNWDMIGYVASAKAYETSDPQVLQQEVYELLRRSVPPERYVALTSGHLRQIRATDPESLRQHLPFYQIRVVYVWLILALWKLGLNPFVASYFISAACAALAIWTLAFMLPGKPSLTYQLVSPVIALLTGFPSLARLSTPDALSALVVFICYWLAFRRHMLLLIALPMCILMRTDLLLLLPAFYIYLWRLRACDRRSLVVSALLSIVLYWSVNAYFGNYGWSTVFDYTFSHKSTHPADFPHAVTMASYLAALQEGVKSLFSAPLFLTYILMTLGGIVSLFWRSPWTQPAVTLWRRDMLFALLSSLAYVVLHFVLFPDIWRRFFAGQYALSMALTMYIVLETARSNTAHAGDASSAAPDLHR